MHFAPQSMHFLSRFDRIQCFPSSSSGRAGLVDRQGPASSQEGWKAGRAGGASGERPPHPTFPSSLRQWAAGCGWEIRGPVGGGIPAPGPCRGGRPARASGPFSLPAAQVGAESWESPPPVSRGPALAPGLNGAVFLSVFFLFF